MCSLLLQEHAFESSQKYKEGKYIIELAHMIKDNGWDWWRLSRMRHAVWSYILPSWCPVRNHFDQLSSYFTIIISATLKECLVLEGRWRGREKEKRTEVLLPCIKNGTVFWKHCCDWLIIETLMLWLAGVGHKISTYWVNHVALMATCVWLPSVIVNYVCNLGPMTLDTAFHKGPYRDWVRRKLVPITQTKNRMWSDLYYWGKEKKRNIYFS